MNKRSEIEQLKKQVSALQEKVSLYEKFDSCQTTISKFWSLHKAGRNVALDINEITSKVILMASVDVNGVTGLSKIPDCNESLYVRMLTTKGKVIS